MINNSFLIIYRILSGILFVNSHNIEHEDFSFEKIDVPIGLYFEKIAQIRMFNSQWNMVYHMNLTTISEEFKAVARAVEELKNICRFLELNYNNDYYNSTHKVKSHFFSRECGTTFDQIEVMLQDAQDFNMEWFHDSNKNCFDLLIRRGK